MYSTSLSLAYIAYQYGSMSPTSSTDSLRQDQSKFTGCNGASTDSTRGNFQHISGWSRGMRRMVHVSTALRSRWTWSGDALCLVAKCRHIFSSCSGDSSNFSDDDKKSLLSHWSLIFSTKFEMHCVVASIHVGAYTRIVSTPSTILTSQTVFRGVFCGECRSSAFRFRNERDGDAMIYKCRVHGLGVIVLRVVDVRVSTPALTGFNRYALCWKTTTDGDKVLFIATCTTVML